MCFYLCFNFPSVALLSSGLVECYIHGFATRHGAWLQERQLWLMKGLFVCQGEDGSHHCSLPDPAAHGPGDIEVKGRDKKLAYTITDVPPWYLCILLGIQV